MNSNTIGIDLGGTNIRAGHVQGKQITSINAEKIIKNGAAEEIITQLFDVTEKLIPVMLTPSALAYPDWLMNREDLFSM